MNLLLLLIFILFNFNSTCLSQFSTTNFKFFNYKPFKSINFIEYQDSSFKFTINPILGIAFESIFDHAQRTNTWGVNISGKHKNGVSFSFVFNDNIVYNLDYYNKVDFLNKQGRILTRIFNNKSEFSETSGYLIFENDWLKTGIIKDNLLLGEGKNSKLILSNRAPTFPIFLINLKMTSWFSVFSLHGWLISGIEDSSRSYQTVFDKRVVEHEKYFALHSFDFYLFDRLTFRLGETIIYSDRGPYLGYMFPFVLFRSIDHMFTYGSDDSGNNGSLFFDGNIKLTDQLKLYGSLFIDELSLSKLLKGDMERNQFGFLFGLEGINFLRNRLNWTVEYTRILPWVYSNWIPAQTYTNNKFPMGHYIGQNSDQIYADVSYKVFPELEITLSGDYTRNGGFSDIKNQYSPPGEEFLYGPVRKILRVGSEVKFNYLKNIYITFEYDFYDVKDEDSLRTPEWQLGKNHFLSLRLFFGLNR